MSTEIKLALSVLSAILCGAKLHYSRGESGIGWFIVSLIVIW